MKKFALGMGIAGTVLATGLLGATPGLASATTSFSVSQHQLEVQLAARQTQLLSLTADVAAAKNLAPSVASTLNARLAVETVDINALIVKVPTDTTQAQLKADRNAMIRDNRVYAVMTPQVHVSIVAANDIAAANNLQAIETKLGSEIQARHGQHGFNRAWAAYQHMVTFVADTKVDASSATSVVLAQTPQGFPANEHFFLRADYNLLRADVALAHAHFDRNVIELFIDGYAAVDSAASSTSTVAVSS